MSFLEIKNLSKVYQGAISYEALKQINLKVNEGEFISIMGPSGSGKTTLLNMIATLDKPTGGTVYINKKEPNVMGKDELAEFRRKELGFIFQNFNLLPSLTVEENIMLPLTLDRVPQKEIKRKTQQILSELEIENLSEKRTFEISGGEAQRVAIARALIHDPKLILADEPTGNLDSKSAGIVMQLLDKFNFERDVTTMIVTHDAISASYSQRVVFIKDGQFYNEIYCGKDRDAFYQKILGVLAHLGGTNHEFQATNRP